MIVYFNNNTGCQILADNFNQITLDHLNGINKGWDYIQLATQNKWCDAPNGRGHKYFL